MARSMLAFVVFLLWATTAHAKLQIANIKAAYGPLGPERQSQVYYPGDEVVFRYLLTGVRSNAKGEANVAIFVQIADASGKILQKTTTPTKGVVALGGGFVPGTAQAALGDSMKPGTYRLAVTATDNLSGETASFDRDITLEKTTFISVTQRFFLDAEGKLPGSAGGLVGQPLYYRLGLIGFDRSQGRIETRMELDVLDEERAHVLAKPTKGAYKNADRAKAARISQVSFSGLMVLNRAGNFTLRFTFTDAVSGQTSRFEVPIKVTDP